MDLSTLAVFAVTLFVAAASPGPGIAAIVARVLARGTGGALAFSVGVGLGDLVWMTAAITGLAALAQAFHDVFVVIKWVGAAYLLYLAWKMWTAPVAGLDEVVARAPADEDRCGSCSAGLAVTMGNPKVMVFYWRCCRGLIEIRAVDGVAFAELVLTVAAVLTVVFGGWILLADRARRLFRSARAIRAVQPRLGRRDGRWRRWRSRRADRPAQPDPASVTAGLARARLLRRRWRSPHRPCGRSPASVPTVPGPTG